MIKIEVKFIGHKSFFKKMTRLFGIHKYMATWNKVIAKFAKDKTIQAMKDAGIKRRTGALFDSVRPDNVTRDGFDIVSSSVAGILDAGRAEEWVIEPTKPHGMLVFEKPGEGLKFIFGPVTHPPLGPRPWAEKAAEDIGKLVGKRYIVNIERLLRG